MLHAPGRENGGFPLYADNEELRRGWMESLQSVIDTAVEPTDESVSITTYEEDEDIYATIQ